MSLRECRELCTVTTIETTFFRPKHYTCSTPRLFARHACFDPVHLALSPNEDTHFDQGSPGGPSPLFGRWDRTCLRDHMCGPVQVDCTRESAFRNHDRRIDNHSILRRDTPLPYYDVSHMHCPHERVSSPSPDVPSASIIIARLHALSGRLCSHPSRHVEVL